MSCFTCTSVYLLYIIIIVCMFRCPRHHPPVTPARLSDYFKTTDIKRVINFDRVKQRRALQYSRVLYLPGNTVFWHISPRLGRNGLVYLNTWNLYSIFTTRPIDNANVRAPFRIRVYIQMFRSRKTSDRYVQNIVLFFFFFFVPSKWHIARHFEKCQDASIYRLQYT